MLAHHLHVSLLFLILLSSICLEQNKDVNNQGYQMTIPAYADKLVLVESFASVLPGVRFIPSLGHTDNHHSIEVVSKGRRLIITGDALLNRVSYAPSKHRSDIHVDYESDQFLTFSSFHTGR